VLGHDAGTADRRRLQRTGGDGSPHRDLSFLADTDVNTDRDANVNTDHNADFNSAPDQYTLAYVDQASHLDADPHQDPATGAC
jgi:hypothetical protein